MAKLWHDMGQNDLDLSPAHDKAMFWLEDWVKGNLIEEKYHECSPELKHIRYKYERSSYHSEDDIPSLQRDSKCSTVAELETLIGEPCPDCELGKGICIEWEYPLLNGRLFLDFVATISQRLPVVWRGPFSVPFPQRKWMWSTEERVLRHAFEVKPKILSIGQVLRQLKIYRMNFEGDIWLVAPGDEKYMRILQREGFGYLDLPANLNSVRDVVCA